MWAIRNLKRSGFSKPDLASFYATFLRSVIEFCVAVYASFLTKHQEEELERLQMHAINVITGGYRSYTAACDKCGLERLSERRKNLTEKFALKAVRSERFGEKWFPLKRQHG